ncbi:glycerol-3-phosphate 1-O-acyltransferase PlsY [Facklamia sp. DSM 111018]|uniref:Glycerol-3-phosphate acyltransferase n=1 Tax=Facklamia lactis TaxID=2749967 RepID=A0ABS0LMI7_9LACT|nr:glycerol-3-phosphate 1-O-acyltransferase PlsY [Facklamia lactis]MBG9979977.1 glycerol-3-phosphate 1-O-acyltransferase PlsY [Facklamia lactis]MBG9985343.1 glycerol-3-phosphate 1-O-acyltransferase PlsY [Facklamia lactis]
MAAFIMIISAYLAGSIPTGVWYSLLVHKVDVRTLGSGNSGGTNIGRNFGPVAALIVITVDVLKGWIPTLIAKHFFAGQADWVVILTAIACVLGHAYPIWGNFKGGKIVATSVGVLLGYNFFIAISQVILLVCFLFLFSIVSVASMLSYALIVVWIIIHEPLIYGMGFALIALFMVYRHRQNIQRIIQGKERHVSFGLRASKKNNL